MEEVRKIGFTIASILAAICSAGMRSGVWCNRRAAPKMAQAAVVASSLGSGPGGIACFAVPSRNIPSTTGMMEPSSGILANLPGAARNFVEPYLRSVIGFLGVTDATFLTTGGTAALNSGQDRDAFLAPHLQAVKTHPQAI
jgi:hypothetical protein